MDISFFLGVLSISRKECVNICRGFLLIFLLLSRFCSLSVIWFVLVVYGGRFEFYGFVLGFNFDFV